MATDKDVTRIQCVWSLFIRLFCTFVAIGWLFILQDAFWLDAISYIYGLWIDKIVNQCFASVIITDSKF